MNRREFIKKYGVLSLSVFLFPLQVGRTAPKTNIQVKQYIKGRKKPSIPNITNPDFRFDNFVLGQENFVAYGILKLETVCPKSQGYILNLHGPRGTGKSHLLHAFKNEMLLKYPDIKIACLHFERFALLCYRLKAHSDFQELIQEFGKFDIIILEDILSAERFIKNIAHSRMILENIIFTLLKKGGTFAYSSNHPVLFESVYPGVHNKCSFLNSSVGVSLPYLETRYKIARMMAKKYKMEDKVSDEIYHRAAKSAGANAYEIQSLVRKAMRKLLS